MVELINREEHEKLYIQLYEILKKKIESHEWKVGTQIPTEEQLCDMFKVSRATVRNAVLELVRQGYLIRQQGKGTFVKKDYVEDGIILCTFFKTLWVKDETKYKKKIVTKTVIMPIDNLSDELKIAENKHIIYTKIFWYIENNLSIIQESYIPFAVCPQLLEENLEVKSITEILEKKCGIKITQIDAHLELNPLTRELALNFSLPEKEPVILLTQKIFSGDTILLLNKFYIKGDTDSLFISFQRRT
ncbi:MAG: GntR family transcriptional regulator [Thermodesulfovibrio sp.]|nr:GntR family transcriptional regulator [Thermodesulfovibrio sp.]MDW7998420.1 GntR family transcriptional regulator [Thermodesulfovibrio sp.]